MDFTDLRLYKLYELYKLYKPHRNIVPFPIINYFRIFAGVRETN